MKKLLVILTGLAVVGALIFFFIFRKKHQPAVDQEIAKRLVALVHDASNGLYHLEMDSLVANVVESKLTLFNARLRPDTVLYQRLLDANRAPQDLFEVAIEQFSIDDISPVDFLTAKEINLDKIYLKDPVIKVIHRKLSQDTVKDDSAKTVYQRLSNKVNSIKVDTIRIEDASFTYDNRTKKKQNKIEKVSFLASDFLLSEETQNDSSRFLFAKNCSVRVREYSLETPDKLYRFSFDELVIETLKKQMVIEKLRFQPMLSESAFYRRVGHQQDMFTLSFQKISIGNIGWWSMLGDEALEVPHMVLESGKLDISNDRGQKPDTRSKMGKYPHQLLMKLAFGLRIDTIQVKNMDMSYNERNPKTEEKGSLRFTGINGKLLNVTNDSAAIRQNPVMKMDVAATFMQQAPLQANFVFDLAKQKSGAFEVSMKLGKLSKDAINQLTIPLGSMQVDEINMKSLDCRIQGNNMGAKGTVRFEYADLKVAALKNADDTLKKRKFLSFIANSFILKSENPLPGKPARTVYPTFTRDPQKSYFNLVWKTMFTGIKMTAGINKKN